VTHGGRIIVSSSTATSTIRGPTFPSCPDPATLATAVEAILRGVETGKYQPLLDRILPLSQIAEAHRYLDSYDCVGKTVVLPGPVGARG